MTDTHDLGRVFVHPINLAKGSPFVHTATTYEVDEPYRESKSLVVRLVPFQQGFVLGWWRNTGRDEQDALMTALQGHREDALDETGSLLPQYEPDLEPSRLAEDGWQVRDLVGA